MYVVYIIAILTEHSQTSFRLNLVVVSGYSTLVDPIMSPVSTVDNQYLASSSRYDGVVCRKWAVTSYYCICFRVSFSSEIPHECWYEC